jgi:hypothetical protein
VTPPAEPYAARLDIDYPEQLDRLTTLLRLIWIIPIGIVYSLLTATGNETVITATGEQVRRTGGGITAGLFVATLLMIVFRQRYPRWWFDFARELTRFGARVTAYLALLTDRYPSTVERTVGASRDRVPGCRTRPQSLAAAGEVAAGDPSLHRAHRALARRNSRRHDCLVRDTRYGALSAGTLRLHSRCWPVEPSRSCLCVLAGHRPLPTLQFELTRPASSGIGPPPPRRT